MRPWRLLQPGTTYRFNDLKFLRLAIKDWLHMFIHHSAGHEKKKKDFFSQLQVYIRNFVKHIEFISYVYKYHETNQFESILHFNQFMNTRLRYWKCYTDEIMIMINLLPYHHHSHEKSHRRVEKGVHSRIREITMLYTLMTLSHKMTVHVFKTWILHTIKMKNKRRICLYLFFCNFMIRNILFGLDFQHYKLKMAYGLTFPWSRKCQQWNLIWI